MRNITTTNGSRQQLRNLAAWRLNAMIRRAGLNHYDVARQAGVSLAQISLTIHRRRRDTPACERVWKALEALLNPESAS